MPDVACSVLVIDDSLTWVNKFRDELDWFGDAPRGAVVYYTDLDDPNYSTDDGWTCGHIEDVFDFALASHSEPAIAGGISITEHLQSAKYLVIDLVLLPIPDQIRNVMAGNLSLSRLKSVEVVKKLIDVNENLSIIFVTGFFGKGRRADGQESANNLPPVNIEASLAAACNLPEDRVGLVLRNKSNSITVGKQAKDWDAETSVGRRLLTQARMAVTSSIPTKNTAEIVQHGEYVEIPRSIASEIDSEDYFAEWLLAFDGYKSVRTKIDRLAGENCNVLILGETGTGKDLVARRLHRLSGRGVYHAINVAALPDSLAESELFGHVKGAFTDAKKDKIGALEYAGAGTLFLDEVGDMSLLIQSKILRVISDRNRRFRRVGESMEREFTGRIVAATNQDVPLMISTGDFRRDLYNRLRSVVIRMPAIRSIPGLPWLLFVKKLEEHDSAIVVRDGFHLSPLLESTLLRKLIDAYDWVGNIREIGNFAETCCMLKLNAEEAIEEFEAMQNEASRSRV